MSSKRKDLRKPSRARALLSEAEMDLGIPELDLHGMGRHEATLAIDAFVERCFAAGDPVIRIIHGRGTGALMAATREALRAHPLVLASSFSNRPDELGAVILAVLDLE